MGLLPWQPDSQAGPSELAGGLLASWVQLRGLKAGLNAPPLDWPSRLESAGLGPWRLVASLALCPSPGQECAVAVLSLVITMRALCSPCHFNLRMARRGNELGQSFEPDPWRRSIPSLEHNDSPGREPGCRYAGPLSPGPSPFVSLPSPPSPLPGPPSPWTSLALHSQPGVPNSNAGCWVVVPKSYLVPTVNLYLLHGRLPAPDLA